MPNIELPPQMNGDEATQLQQMWSYLYQLAQDLNINFAATGGNDLTDGERQVMQQIITKSGENDAANQTESESLKSLIIKTADYVQNTISEFRTSFIGDTAANGQFGEYVRKTRLDVDVTPEGVKQNYSFREIMQGLKTYEVNAKNYIKTGLLRTVSSIPVYGVAIGKDVVTFSEDGTETYNDGNKVAELTADELSFWQNGHKIAKYTGSKIAFLYNDTEVLYIQNGKIYCANDFEIAAGKNFKVQATDFEIDSANKRIETGSWRLNDRGLTYTLTNEEHGIGTYANLDLNNNKDTGYISTEVDQYGAIFHLMNKTPNKKITQLKAVVDNDFEQVRLYAEGFVSGGQQFTVKGVLAASYPPGQTVGLWDVWGSTIYYSVLQQYSSRNVKHDIQPLEDRGEMIDRLEPVTFKYNDDKEERQHAGLIYEDTIGIMPEICNEAEGQKSITYVELIPVLLKEIQNLRKRVAMLEKITGTAE